MITITAKDRIFVMLAVPLAVLACYFFLVRPSYAQKAARLDAAMVELDDPGEQMRRMALLKARLAELEASLKESEAEDHRATPNTIVSSAEPSTRLQRIVNILEEQSVRVVHSEWMEPLENAVVEPDPAVIALQKAGVLEHPDCWNLELESSYDALVKALSEFRANGLPVIPLSVSMDTRGRVGGCHWKVKLWL